jgi:hypothetical protein
LPPHAPSKSAMLEAAKRRRTVRICDDDMASVPDKGR